MPKDTYYFSHDYHSRSDKKMVRLLAKSGIEGVGIFWCLVEMLYEEGGYLLLEECECIADELRTHSERIEAVIKDYKLFENDGVKFWSNSVLTRLEIRNSKSLKAKESANNRWSKNANALPTQSEGNAIKEKKGNKIKGKESVITPPLLSEVILYFDDKGYSETSAKKAFEYYTNLEWHNKDGKPIANWKNTMLNNWFKTDNLKTLPVNGVSLKIDHRKTSGDWK